MESKNSLSLRAAFPEAVPTNGSHAEWHSRCYIKYGPEETLSYVHRFLYWQILLNLYRCTHVPCVFPGIEFVTTI